MKKNTINSNSYCFIKPILVMLKKLLRPKRNVFLCGSRRKRAPIFSQSIMKGQLSKTPGFHMEIWCWMAILKSDFLCNLQYRFFAYLFVLNA